MIRSQLKPGDRIIGKYYKGNLSFKGILIKKIDSHSYLFFVEELGSETNIGYKKYSEVDILIYDKQETLLDELLTSNNLLIRQVGLRLLKS